MPTPYALRRRATRWAAVVLGLSTLLAGAATSSATAATRTALAAPAHPLVVIGVAGVQWSQISATATPAMWSLLEQGSTATVTVRSVYATTCPVDGWLTVNAGQRAADVRTPFTGQPGACRQLEEPGRSLTRGPSNGPWEATVPNWATYAAQAEKSNFDPTLGLLSAQLTGAGVCATAIGPGAAIALADSRGHVAAYEPASALSTGVGAAITRCPLTVVDAGGIAGPDDLLAGQPSNGIPAAEQLHAVDTKVASVLAQTPSTATVLLVGLADSTRVPHLRVVAMRGNGFGPGVLYASSTRQLGLVQLTDITPTILDQLSVPVPDTLGGSPLEHRADPSGVAERRRDLLDYDEAAQQVHTAVPRFFTGLVLAQLLLYGFAAIALRRRWTGERGRERTLRAVRRVALLFASVPVATFLANTVPWWRTSHPLITLPLVVAAYATAIFALATLGPWRRHPLGDVSVVTVVTLAVLALDVMFGSRLQLSTLMGLQPVVAGRFYGMGNVTYALFATAGLLLATALADPLVRAGRRREAGLTVVAVGAFVVVVDAWPAWGSDFGGPPASIPAFAFLTFAVLGIRLTWRRVLLILAGTVAVVSVVSVLDWLRPPEDQSHLGKFVQTVIDGGAWDVMKRKLAQNMDILFSNILSLLVPVGVLFVVLVLLRPSSWGANALQRAFDRSPVFRAGLLSGLVMWVIGFSLNDSGTAIPAVSATLAIPLVIATSITALGPAGDPPAPLPPPAQASPRTA